MYISGQINNLNSRIHQLAISSGDLSSFKQEGQAYSTLYSGTLSKSQIKVWNNEIAKKYSTNFKNNSYYYSGAIS